ncbi:hypothetical protein OIU74_009745 [Salix koriyanagi]|uniref:Uncharacterized protein n=1 Tax=Salix koriyanagi TaxID=2511006 RepID=A0A9Q0TSY7_9ROSI|nr:hypothetical protein OIU74_009745 [Salix koriyanagi]
MQVDKCSSTETSKNLNLLLPIILIFQLCCAACQSGSSSKYRTTIGNHELLRNGMYLKTSSKNTAIVAL